ncbi:transposase domain-containing protein [Streptomyces hygroscopicus]|uniref:transposase domain-containing protein n=1 Tax=Streptomyces hygroscopicus TaxID=1912 RepID=UPI00368D0C43
MPGQLGVLTRWVPPDLVDEVLAATGRLEKRVRMLPARVVVYFVLAMTLFGDCGYRGVWAALTAGMPGHVVPDPSAAALRQARRRLGTAPLALLFDRLCGPVGTKGTPGVFWHGLRVVAWDGTSVEVADSTCERGALRKPWEGDQPTGRLSAGAADSPGRMRHMCAD